jgi:hypothetical protein
MPKLRFVIDASVAGRAGMSQHPSSRANRNFLMRARSACHRIAVSVAMRNEWDEHQSVFAQKWLASMTSKRKVDRIRTRTNSDLRAAVDTAHQGRDAMRKDVHLIEAAWLVDHTVISTDDSARAHFAALVERVEALRPIVWVNPERDSEEVLRWLRRGVHPKPEWKLAGA